MKMKYRYLTMAVIFILLVLLAYLVGSTQAAEPYYREDRPVIEAIQQAPPAPTGLVVISVSQPDGLGPCRVAPFLYYWDYDQSCRSIPQPDDLPAGPNLFDPDGWILTYGKRDNCEVDQSNRVITMTKTLDGWPPCGVRQTIASAVGKRYMIVANVVDVTDQSEVYTDFDGSIFKPGIGTRVDVLTSKYKDFTVWLQTYTTDISLLPITTVWKNIVIVEIN